MSDFDYTQIDNVKAVRQVSHDLFAVMEDDSLIPVSLEDYLTIRAHGAGCEEDINTVAKAYEDNSMGEPKHPAAWLSDAIFAHSQAWEAITEGDRDKARLEIQLATAAALIGLLQSMTE